MAQLFDRVVNPEYNQKILIETARQYERKSKEQDEIKAIMPCFTSAFQFNGYINNKNATVPTGYLYIDVDNVESIELDHPSVVFYCKSFSGKGYTIIVGVVGVTKENIKAVTLQVASELDIKVDEAAISIDRLTVVSYDLGAYYNANHTYFLFIDSKLNNPHYNNISNITYCNEYNGGETRFDNISDFIDNIDFEGEVMKDFGKDKIEYFKISFPFKDVEVGWRNKTLNYICYYLKALNPQISKNECFSLLNSVNVNKLKPPLEDNDLNEIIDSVFRITEFKIKPNSKRRFIYNPDYKLTTTEKRRINIYRIHECNRNNTLESLNQFIDSWDFILRGKITQHSLSDCSGHNIKTIEKHYKSLKTKIKDKNLAYKNKK